VVVWYSSHDPYPASCLACSDPATQHKRKGGEILGFILEKIEEAIKELLIGWIECNLTNMFTDVNDKVGT
jgi:hypothetical protein